MRHNIFNHICRSDLETYTRKWPFPPIHPEENDDENEIEEETTILPDELSTSLEITTQTTRGQTITSRTRREKTTISTTTLSPDFITYMR